MKQHTPGPWTYKVLKGGETEITGPLAGFVFRPCSMTGANAQLIAAAPELLEALKSSELIVAREAERIAEAHRNAGHPKSLNVTALVLESIQAAIAKATHKPLEYGDRRILGTTQ